MAVLSERSRLLKILTLNCGSSTLKYDVLDHEPRSLEVTRFATGSVERIGGKGRLTLTCGDDEHEETIVTANHHDAFLAAYEKLEASGCLEGLAAVGHRVVHGGLNFHYSVRIDDQVIKAIREVTDLAPLHNAPALAVIEAARQRLGPSIPHVAAFDTAYFADLPEVASRYAIPRQLSEKHGIRRFGFHGLAHGYMVRRFQELQPDIMHPRLITLQLGSGCSVAASFGAVPVDTSMGYTPLEGLIMGTRSGSLDPALPLRLQSLNGMTASEVESLLNHESGLLGLSGRSGEMRDLVSPEARNDPDVRFAIEAFCNSVRKYIGAYMALMGGADGIVFGGGIGENLPEIRKRICWGLEWAGLTMDDDANRQAAGVEAKISGPRTSVLAWVVQVDEATVIGRETLKLLTH